MLWFGLFQSEWCGVLPVMELEIKTKKLGQGVSELDRVAVHLFLSSPGLFLFFFYN